MQKSFTYKQKTYRLQAQETPETLRKWDEVIHYLNHLPEFVNEVFDEQQMDNIVSDFFDYVKGKSDGEKKTLQIQKTYQGQNCKVAKRSSKPWVWWQIAVERLFCCDDIRNKVMDVSAVRHAMQTLCPPDASDLLQVTYLQKQYFLLRQGAFEDTDNKLLQY